MRESSVGAFSAGSFVQCRADANVPEGFEVGLSCDARPNQVLYTAGTTVAAGTVTLSGDASDLQVQVERIAAQARDQLLSRGLTDSTLIGSSLSVSEMVELLAELVTLSETGPQARVTVQLKARSDIRLDSPVSLQAEVVRLP